MSSEPQPTAEPESHFDYLRTRLGFVLAPIAFIAVLLRPFPTLNPQAHALAAIMALTVILWMTEAIPMAVTALLGPALCVLMGVAKDDAVFASFGHKIVLLFIGSFLLAQAMQKHGLDRRIAFAVMSIPGVGKSPGRLLAALGLLTATLSMWMSNTAMTAVMLPIALGVLRTSPRLAENRAFSAAMVLMIAFAASIGGLATPVGTPTNLVALSQLERAGFDRPNFFDWMRLALPLSLVLLAALFVILRPRKSAAFDPAAIAAEIRRQKAEIGPMTRGEWNASIAFVFALTLWMYPGLMEMLFGRPGPGEPDPFGLRWMNAHLGEETIGLLAGLLLFILPTNVRRWEFTLNWKDGAKIDWGTVLLFGGGLALGKQIFDTGLAKGIGDGVIALLGSPGPGLLMAVAIVLSIALSEATSNTASANVMVPMMIAVANSAGVNPIPLALGTCLACSFGFMLPISTPPNALAYSTGLVRLPAMIRAGVWLDIVGAITIWVMMMLLAPLLGWK